jgi:peptidoglycan/LPS O-acetylase OafA/YrhL
MLDDKRRIGGLDGLRFVAIMLVAGFHYFSAWTPPGNARNYYPYGGALARVFDQVFSYGHLGVQLFFIVSGFVITMTLARCGTIGEFAARRFARLWPTMLLAALVTFAFLSADNSLFQPAALDFIPSLTFTDPSVFDALTNTTRFEWMDSAYWSLVVEVKFYALIAIIYFTSGRSFKAVLLAVATGVAVLAGAAAAIDAPVLRDIMQDVFISGHLSWFMIGIGGYFWFRGERAWALAFSMAGLLPLLAYSALRRDPVVATSAVAFTALFYAALALPIATRVLTWRPVALLGAASYSFYLLHQEIGVTLIHEIAGALGLSPGLSLIVPLLVTALIGAASVLIYRFYETPMDARLVSLLTRRRQAVLPLPLPVAGAAFVFDDSARTRHRGDA